jgi:hypothetical protein
MHFALITHVYLSLQIHCAGAPRCLVAALLTSLSKKRGVMPMRNIIQYGGRGRLGIVLKKELSGYSKYWIG